MLKIRKLHGEVACSQIFPREISSPSRSAREGAKIVGLGQLSFVLLFFESLAKQLLKAKSDLHK